MNNTKFTIFVYCFSTCIEYILFYLVPPALAREIKNMQLNINEDRDLGNLVINQWPEFVPRN